MDLQEINIYDKHVLEGQGEAIKAKNHETFPGTWLLTDTWEDDQSESTLTCTEQTYELIELKQLDLKFGISVHGEAHFLHPEGPSRDGEYRN